VVRAEQPIDELDDRHARQPYQPLKDQVKDLRRLAFLFFARFFRQSPYLPASLGHAATLQQKTKHLNPACNFTQIFRLP
jgi:hypothetical protein